MRKINTLSFLSAITAMVIVVSSFKNTPIRKSATSVAIVIDRNTYGNVEKQVKDYASSIKKYDGKNAFIIITGKDTAPEAIRDTLESLYNNRNLEGAVLVGDIPVAMVRGANYLATAFKMNPKRKWKQSSVPSDRYYDDFGLKFDFIKRDTSDSLLYYYNLAKNSAQYINCNIYSARIKPRKDNPQVSFSQYIAGFLERSAAAKQKEEKMDNVFHFAGYGNSSESFNARIDEDRAIYEQMGFKGPDEKVSFINFDEDRYIKPRLKEILADTSLDLAFLHHHGEPDEQFLSKTPYTYNAGEYIDFAKKFFRGKIRNARDTAKARKYYLKEYDIPADWINNTFDSKVTAEDSLTDASMVNVLDDMNDYGSGVKVLILDACFNGAFIHDDYMAARYAFDSKSSTMDVFANSVNIIQDHWKNELMGLLSYGVCVGNWAKQHMTLESHIFGDPTYSFSQPDGRHKTICKKYGTKQRTLDMEIARPNYPLIKKMLQSEEADIRAFAIKQASAMGKIPDMEILNILKTAPELNVRLEAFMTLIRKRSPLSEQAIATALDDPYELLRRLAAKYDEVCGAPMLLRPTIEHYLNPHETSRVVFHLKRAVALYPYEQVKNLMDSIYNAHKGIWPERRDYDKMLRNIKISYGNDLKEFADINNPSVKDKTKRFTISAQRNRCNPEAAEEMIKLISNGKNKELRLAATEALGWYSYSYRKEYIISSCNKIIGTISDEDIKEELRKTVARLTYKYEN